MSKIVTSFYDTDAKHKHLEYYVDTNDLKQGICKTYHQLGFLMEETNYENGMKNGKEKIFNDDNTIKGTINYKNDMRDGLLTIYKYDGGIELTVNYENGLQHGETVKYQNGEKHVVMTFEKGQFSKPTITYQTFINKGKIYTEQSFIKDKDGTPIPHGPFIMYDIWGGKSEINYVNGKHDGGKIKRHNNRPDCCVIS